MPAITPVPLCYAAAGPATWPVNPQSSGLKVANHFSSRPGCSGASYSALMQLNLGCICCDTATPASNLTVPSACFHF